MVTPRRSNGRRIARISASSLVALVGLAACGEGTSPEVGPTAADSQAPNSTTPTTSIHPTTVAATALTTIAPISSSAPTTAATTEPAVAQRPTDPRDERVGALV